jgi:hypothetical protein
MGIDLQLANRDWQTIGTEITKTQDARASIKVSMDNTRTLRADTPSVTTAIRASLRAGQEDRTCLM